MFKDQSAPPTDGAKNALSSQATASTETASNSGYTLASPGTPEPPESSRREQPCPRSTAAPQSAATAHSPHPVFVSYKKFDWKNDDVETYQYLAWWEGRLLFEVGYRKTPHGVQTSLRRVLPKGQGYSSTLFGIKRPLYRVRTVARLKKVIFAENEPAADELNRRLAKMELGEKMVATTTSGGPGQSHKTTFT